MKHVVPNNADTIEVDGIKYSREIFKFFSEDAKNGDLHQFVSRKNHSDGAIVTIRTVNHCGIFEYETAMETVLGYVGPYDENNEDVWGAKKMFNYLKGKFIEVGK